MLFNMSFLLFFPFRLLRWNSLVELFFLFLYRNHAEGIIHPCQGCLRQTELSHLRGVLGPHRALEHRLGDQMFQVLFHPLHHHLLLSVLFLIISLAWGHAVGTRLHFFLLIRTQPNVQQRSPTLFCTTDQFNVKLFQRLAFKVWPTSL